MARRIRTVAEQRNYSVLDVKSAKQVCSIWLERAQLQHAISFGLPEVDDRYHVWRVPLLNKSNRQRIGEVVIDARTSLILEDKSTDPAVLEARLLGRSKSEAKRAPARANGHYELSTLRNTIALGDSEEILQELPAGSVDLVFTSPPYYNARPEYTDYITYEEYLLKIRKVIQNVHRVLATIMRLATSGASSQPTTSATRLFSRLNWRKRLSATTPSKAMSCLTRLPG